MAKSDPDGSRAFWRAYDELSANGYCDSPGGAESRRVFDEWIGAGQPPPQIHEFIRRQANT
jgi:hypothetical protein